MRNTAKTLTGAMGALLTAGALAFTPVAATAGTQPPVNLLTATLASTQASGAHGVATYTHDLRATAGRLTVRLSHLPVTTTPIVKIYVQGSLLARAAITAPGAAMVDLSTSTAPQSGATVTVTSGTGTLLAVGQLHAPASLGNGGPSPSSGQR